MAIFQRHFSCDEANGMLPALRDWFAELHRLEAELAAERARVEPVLALRQHDVGGPVLHAYLMLWMRWRHFLDLVLKTGVQVKDLERGLIDFPHLREDTGEEVLLCWELSEPTVSHWHPVDAGYAGRQPLRRLQQPEEHDP
ncbi:MAG: DUF2203 domain-containing protein [Armatimonadetes bacterium]|nr:DUF2203 domain-containing protein [Armatimonadota bacterium]